MKALILFQVFNKETPTVLSVVNWGDYEGNKIVYPTKDGLQKKTKQQIEQDGNTRVFHFEDLDIQSSLHWWFKANQSAYSKEIEIDYTIETGEVYKGNCWHLPLMINNEGSTIKVKPIYQ